MVKRLVAAVALVVATTVGLLGTQVSPAAASDTVYGDPASVVVENLNYGIEKKLGTLGYWVKCSFAGYWETTSGGLLNGSRLYIKGKCKRGPAIFDSYMWLSVDAGPCGKLEFDVGNIDDEPFQSPEGYFNPVPMEGCGPVTQLCVDGDKWEHECFPWDVGAPPDGVEPEAPIPGGCVYGAPSAKPTVQRVFQPTPGSEWNTSWTVTVTIPGWTPGQVTSGGFFRPYLVLAPKPSGMEWFTPSPTANGTGTSSVKGQVDFVRLNPTVGQPPGWTSQRVVYTWSGDSSSKPDEPAPVVLGVGLMFGVPVGPADQWASYPTVPVQGVDGNRQMPVGYTSAEGCGWYWGEKIVEGHGTADEPLGPVESGEPGGGGNVTPPRVYVGPPEDCPEDATVCVETNDDPPSPQNPNVPDPDGESCNFSITSPSTWGGQLICAVVKLFQALFGLIGDLIRAVKGLVSALLGGLLDLFKTLFVPSGDFISEKVGELKDAWSDSTIGNWLGAFGSITPSAPGGGGCQGPHVSFPVYGKEFKADPLSACSGAAATTAGIVRVILSAIIAVNGGLACVRILGSGFGWSPRVGGAE